MIAYDNNIKAKYYDGITTINVIITTVHGGSNNRKGRIIVFQIIANTLLCTLHYALRHLSRILQFFWHVRVVIGLYYAYFFDLYHMVRLLYAIIYLPNNHRQLFAGRRLRWSKPQKMIKTSIAGCFLRIMAVDKAPTMEKM
jgi:hypothetical protein